MNAKDLLRVLREAQQDYLITYIDDDGDEKEQKISASSPSEARAKVKKFAKEIVDVETLSEAVKDTEKSANCRNCGERNDAPSGKYCQKCKKLIGESNDEASMSSRLNNSSTPCAECDKPWKNHSEADKAKCRAAIKSRGASYDKNNLKEATGFDYNYIEKRNGEFWTKTSSKGKCDECDKKKSPLWKVIANSTPEGDAVYCRMCEPCLKDMGINITSKGFNGKKLNEDNYHNSAYNVARREGRKVFYEAATETIRQCPQNYCLLVKRNGKWEKMIDKASTINNHSMNQVLEGLDLKKLSGEQLAKEIEDAFFG